ncbi:hypothetical protein V8C40DRAFT_161545 [Trichoderma camerunense]
MPPAPLSDDILLFGGASFLFICVFVYVLNLSMQSMTRHDKARHRREALAPLEISGALLGPGQNHQSRSVKWRQSEVPTGPALARNSHMHSYKLASTRLQSRPRWGTLQRLFGRYLRQN